MGTDAQNQNSGRSTRRQWAAWVATFALIVQMLVPLAQAVAFDIDPSIEYQVICTTTGIKQIPIGENGAPIEPTDVASCPFCVVHITPALLIPQETVFIVLEDPVAHATFGLPRQQIQPNVWRSALRPSRAPPLFV